MSKSNWWIGSVLIALGVIAKVGTMNHLSHAIKIE